MDLTFLDQNLSDYNVLKQIDQNELIKQILNNTGGGVEAKSNLYNITNMGIFFKYQDKDGNYKFGGLTLNPETESFYLLKNLINISQINDYTQLSDINIQNLNVKNINLDNTRYLTNVVTQQSINEIDYKTEYNVPMFNYYISNNIFTPTSDYKSFLCRVKKVYSISINLDSVFKESFGDRCVYVKKNNNVIFSYKSPILVRPLQYTISISFKQLFDINDVLSIYFSHNCYEEPVSVIHANNILCINPIF